MSARRLNQLTDRQADILDAALLLWVEEHGRDISPEATEDVKYLFAQLAVVGDNPARRGDV